MASLAIISGVICLVVDAVRGPTQLCRALGGLLLILSGGLHIFLWRWTRCSRDPAAGLWISQPNRFFLWLLAGWLGCYVAALAVGPRPGIAWLFYGLFTLWSTALFGVVAMPPRIPDALLRSFRSYWSVALARVTILLLLAFVSAELGLRSYGLLTGDPMTARYMV
ncbi:MAG: hypothetical protein WBB95_00190, partial [Pseudomonas sp.]|uniref:hypothetical protein n=1 Tax=Pseudomonas sp. TaxID=306 RepID=UPI003C772C10